MFFFLNEKRKKKHKVSKNNHVIHYTLIDMHGLQSIPSHSFYRHNTNIVPNSQDSRVAVTSGGTRKRRQRRVRRRTQTKTRRNGGKKGKGKSKAKSHSKRRTANTRYDVNYAGRQIGHQTRSQSGGMSFLPGDANLITSQVGHMFQNGVATLRGLDQGPNPLPFSDKVNMNNQNL